MLAVLFDGCSDELVDERRVELRVDGVKIACCRDHKLPCAVDEYHVVDKFIHNVVTSAYMIGNVFVSKQPVRVL